MVLHWKSLSSWVRPFYCQCLSMVIAWLCARRYTTISNGCGWSSRIHKFEGVSTYFCIYSIFWTILPHNCVIAVVQILCGFSFLMWSFCLFVWLFSGTTWYGNFCILSMWNWSVKCNSQMWGNSQICIYMCHDLLNWCHVCLLKVKYS